MQLLGADAAAVDRMDEEAEAAAAGANEELAGDGDDVATDAQEDEGAADQSPRRSSKQAAAGAGNRTADAPEKDGKGEEAYSDDEFGFTLTERRHTLRSFKAYAEWAKRLHFSAQPCNGEASKKSKPKATAAAVAAAETPPPAKKQKREEQLKQEGNEKEQEQQKGEQQRQSSRIERKVVQQRKVALKAAAGSVSAKKKAAETAAAAKAKAKGASCSGSSAAGKGDSQVSIQQMEAEFWRVVERPDSGRIVETLYGQDLDSGRHGSGFPLPAWRGLPTDARTGRHLRLDPKAQEYSTHPWNINNMPRNPLSVLRYVRVTEPITGVMVPWLYVGSCLSAFCWHVEDHGLYSVNYLHTGAAKVWYGVPAYASEALEVAFKDALPHLFEADPLLLHRLVTTLSPNELRARGIPVYR
jgi:hypothetical protein